MYQPKTVNYLHLILMFFLSVFVTGCSLTQERPDTVRLVVQAAVYAVIDDEDDARTVVEIATEVRAIASATPELTIPTLIATIDRRVPWEDIGDRSKELLIRALLLELQIRLEDHFDGEVIPADLRLTVNNIATWVIDAASIAAPQARSGSVGHLPARPL